MFVHNVTLSTPVNRKSLILLARLISSTVASVVKNRFIILPENSIVKFRRLRKALLLSAFFVACHLSFPVHSQPPENCPSFISSETAFIRYVHDGDTVHLSDSRKVRLIGIDTPELARKTRYQLQPEQAFAKEARDYVRDLIKQLGNQVKLMPGTEPADKYNRQLFHIQLSDGSLLQTRLLNAGLAVAYTTPPNQKFSQCYLQQESAAKTKQIKIWGHSKYKNIAVNELSPKNKGFHIIRGRVRHIGESKKAFWINFQGNFSARISKSDLKYFTYPLQTLVGKTITVKGWIRHYKNKAQISLRHPSAIEQR